MFNFNVWAALVAAVSCFLVGGLWYSPALFGSLWSREAGRTDVKQGGHPARVFGVSFVFACVAAFAFAWWLGPAPPLGAAVLRGALVGACMVGASFGINYQFADRSALMWAIDAGYHTVMFILFGVVLGLWH